MEARTRTSNRRALLPPSRGDFLVLDDAQELRLKFERHVADLVEQKGSLVGEFEQAHAAGGRGAREGALLVAEQLGLEQVSRDRGAIDLEKGPAVARAPRR